MDNQNQLKTSLSGGHDSHGVYICHRCGWPFPNPHPSARHRRAHKKICGSIEGYKLFDSEGHIHLNASDDEHEQHSDEEHRTPSPKFEKRRISGDDVFSDAATEFPDSGISPAKEEHLESIAGSDKSVEKAVEADLDAGQLLKVDGIEDITKPLDSPSKSSQEPKVVETATTAPLKETSTEELGIPISSLNGSPIKSEIPMGSPKEIIPVNEEDDLDKMSATAAKPPSKTINEASEAELQLQDSDVSVQGQSEQSGLEIPKPDVEYVELRETSIKTVQFSADSAEDIGVGSQGDSVEPSDTKGEKKEYLRFHSAANHFPVDQPEVLIEDFIDHKEVKSDLMSLHDLPPQAESVEHLGASFDTVETKSDSAPRVYTDTESVEVCDTKGEDKEDFHVLSPADLPIVDQPEIMIQDFKDHKAVKSSLSLNLDSDEVIKTAEVGIEDAVEKEDILKQEGNKNNLVTEKPVEKEDDASDLKVTHGEDLGLNGLEAPPDSSDVVPMVNSVDEGRERDVELSAKVESEDSLCISKADQISKSTGEYVGGEHENSRLKIESTGGETGKENFATNTETKLDSASQLSELPSVDSVPDSTKVDFDPREVTKETESGIGTVATGSESNHTTDVEKVEKISMKHDLKESTTLPIDSGSTTHVADVEVAERKSDKPIFEETGPVLVDSGLETKTSGTVDKNGSSVCYEPKQDEGDDKVLKQQVGASAVYVSVDSISQTDSLEGNWGSVSVLSVQSDAPANIDAEALPSDDSQAPTKSEDDFQKPKVGLEGSHSDKQEDDLEPPSYTTLVESEGCGVEPKAADSKTNTLQTSEKPNAEALQSGWFPSLTNVVNESQGRKKNEEVIAKVTNWSAGTAKEHSNLKNLLSEANADAKPKSPSPKQAPSSVSQKDKNVSDVKAASVECSEASADQVVKKETAKEWNSPARYPTEIKKEKRKAKGKPSWVPLFCCSSASVN